MVFGPINGAFARGEDLVEVFEEAEPLFERAVGEGDFEISDRSASFMSAQDADAEGAAGVLDKVGETSVESLVVFGLLAAFFESLIEDELIQTAELKDFVDGFKFAAKGEVIGAGAFWQDRDWTKRQGEAF